MLSEVIIISLHLPGLQITFQVHLVEENPEQKKMADVVPGVWT